MRQLAGGGDVRRPTDEISELARSFRGGDEGAYERLQELVRERLYRLAYRLTGRTEDALDVVQDALFKVYRDIDAWNERSAFYSWLYRVTSNLAIDRLRRRKKSRELKLRLVRREPRNQPRTARHVTETHERHDTEHHLARLRAAVDTLPPGQRAIVMLRHFEGLSLADIADVRGCALGTVKSTLHQAFRNLKHAFAAEGAEETRDHG
jgi:RNA polymerase sigma-70 factor (ECF subfamily)